jgi:hypothetical protein
MRMKSLLIAGLGALGLGLLATSAQAAPAGGLMPAIDRDAARASPVETVTWNWRRHCHWHHGYRHCWHGYRHHGWRDYGYYRYGHPHRYHYGYNDGYRRSWY